MDVGRDKLAGGKAEVRLDPEFAAVVKGDDHHVFLTPYDAASKGLAVTAQRPNGFTVQELGGGTGSGGFSYRVSAKRKDIPGPRLEKVDLRRVVPPIKLPDPPAPLREVRAARGWRTGDSRAEQAPVARAGGSRRRAHL